MLFRSFLNVKPVSFEARGCVFALGRRRRRVERDCVRIVNQNQIIETKMSRERAGFRGDPFLQTAVAREANAVLIENAMLARIESCRRHFHRHRDADGIPDALPERTGRALDARRFEKLRMARRLAVKLTEAFDLFHRQVVTAHVQPRVEKHAAVAGRENKVVAPDPARFIWIMLQGMAIKNGAHLGAAQRQTEMPGFRSLDRVHGQAARFIRRARETFDVQTHVMSIIGALLT